MQKLLFVTDLDDTLVGDDEALEVLNHRLLQHRREYELIIAYITGRSLEAYQTELKAKRPLLEPDIIAPSVGTEIYYKNSATPDADWWKYLSGGWERELIVSTLAEIEELRPQPVADQREFKVSYYLESPESAAILSQIELLLQEQGMSVEVIYSSSRNLDILPAHGNKGKAMAFIREKLDMEPTATVACGDSGNDRALFEDRPEKGIIVGNAQTELIEWHYQNPADNRYLAKAHYARGILEGLTNFGFFQP